MEDFGKMLVALFQKIKNFDLKKALDTLLDWIRALVSTTKKLAQDVFSSFFTNSKDQRYLRKRGYEATKFDNNILTLCPIRK